MHIWIAFPLDTYIWEKSNNRHLFNNAHEVFDSINEHNLCISKETIKNLWYNIINNFITIVHKKFINYTLSVSSNSSSFSSSSHNFFWRSRFWIILAASFMSARTTCLWDEMPFTDLILRLKSLFTIAPNSLSRS